MSFLERMRNFHKSLPVVSHGFKTVLATLLQKGKEISIHKFAEYLVLIWSPKSEEEGSRTRGIVPSTLKFRVLLPGTLKEFTGEVEKLPQIFASCVARLQKRESLPLFRKKVTKSPSM